MFENRLVYKAEPTAKRERAPEAPEAEPTAAALAEAREALELSEDQRIEKRIRQMRDLISRFQKEAYKKGDWVKWNEAFLTAMGHPLGTEEENRNVMRGYQRLLAKDNDLFSGPYDGQFGPESLIALQAYMVAKHPDEAVHEEKEQGPEAEILATYYAKDEHGKPNPDEAYYEMADGTWMAKVGEDMMPVKFADILPKIAEATFDPEFYSSKRNYRIRLADGVLHYFNQDGEEVRGALSTDSIS